MAKKESFHVHATFGGCTTEQIRAIAKRTRSKITEIDLYQKDGEHLQRDRTVTRYGRTFDDVFNATVDFVQEITLVRLKIEQIVRSFDKVDFPDRFCYYEAHMQVREDFEIQHPLLLLSKNPHQGKRFINARMYTKEQLDDFLKVRDSIPTIDEQLEICYYDTAPEIDAAWVS